MIRQMKGVQDESHLDHYLIGTMTVWNEVGFNQ